MSGPRRPTLVVMAQASENSFDSPQEKTIIGRLSLQEESGALSAPKRWTKSEDEALIRAVRQGRSEQYIEEHILQNRSDSAIRARKTILRNKGVLEEGDRQGDPWNEADDEALIAAVREGRSSNYIRENILLQRSESAITVRRYRLQQMGRLDVNKRKPWTEAENEALLNALEEKRSIEYIRKHILPNRTYRAIQTKATLFEEAALMQSEVQADKIVIKYDDPWTDEEDNTLIAAVEQGRTELYIRQHIFPDRTRKMIQARKAKLREAGLLSKGRIVRKWTEEEIEILIAAVEKGFRGIDIHDAQLLPERNYNAIKQKRKILVIEGKVVDPLNVDDEKSQSTRWTEGDDQALRSAVGQGKSDAYIKEHVFPSRSVNEISIRRVVLGINDSPGLFT